MNLDDLTPEVLAELTNVGTVRRASKDLDVAIAWTEQPDGSLVAEAADGTRCVLGPGPFDDWECSCPAMFRCRHLVRAVLIRRRDHPAVPTGGSTPDVDPRASEVTQSAPGPEASAQVPPEPPSTQAPPDAPSPPDGHPGDGPTAVAPAPADAADPSDATDPDAADPTDAAGPTAPARPATPARPPEADAPDARARSSAPVSEAVFGARLAAQGERLAAAGITARVTTVPRLRVRLLHPFDIGVRYPLGTDARYARCECGAPTCVHLYLAERARALAAPGLAEASAVLVDTTIPAADRVDAAPWHAWLDQLLDVGLGAADALIGGAVRLASAWEAQGHVHPGAALREIITQLEHHRGHDAQLSPERLLLLIGEVEARLRALSFDGPAPHAVVAGRPDAEVAGESARLLGLGAEWTHVGGWNALRVFLLDVRTGAVLTLDAEREDTADALVQPADLLAQRRSGVALGDWAVGNALVPRFRRRGDRMTIGRTRVSVAPSPVLDLAGLGAVVPDGFADVAAQLSGVPGPLGPRRPADGVLLAPVAAVGDVRVDATAGLVTAELTDSSGATADLVLPWSDRTAEGARRLVGVLSDGGVTAVAGRWRLGEGGLDVVPTAVWLASGVFLPQVDRALGCDPVGPPRLPAGVPDPWRAAWDAVADPLGRLLILGGRRGAATVAPELARAALAAEASGMPRLSVAAHGLATAVRSSTTRRAAFADTCVLLAFAD